MITWIANDKRFDFHLTDGEFSYLTSFSNFVSEEVYKITPLGITYKDKELCYGLQLHSRKLVNKGLINLWETDGNLLVELLPDGLEFLKIALRVYNA